MMKQNFIFLDEMLPGIRWMPNMPHGIILQANRWTDMR